ncbi:terpene synthase family protein [Echinicola shivajiensis]|uniref:terpene synthase family protein n=1 Tax=Echinicola shivajiensis TaxID=1035916 RepID=UPI001BFC6DA9|nr:terpene synthase family protein [Echinicola shivajiensis]
MKQEKLYEEEQCSKLNPHFKVADQLCREWAATHIFFLNDEERKKTHDQQLNKFAARLFPNADKQEMLQISKLFLVLFCLDDRADQLKGQTRIKFWKELIKKYDHIHRGIHAYYNDAIGKLFWEIHWGWFRDRARKIGLGIQLSQFIRKFLKAGLWEAKNLQKNKPPTIIKYVHQLKHCSGAGIAIELLGYLQSNKLSPQVFHHPKLEPLYQTITEIICFTNDLSSYEKEKRDGDLHNLVLLKEMQYHIPLEESIKRIKERLDFLQQIYVNQHRIFPLMGNTHLQEKIRLIKAIYAMLQGMEIWVSKDTRRYKNNSE